MHPGLLIGAGFLVGACGAKVVCSKPVRKLAVATTRLGLKARNCVEKTIDGAKAEIDDIVADAEFLNEVEAEADACTCGCGEGEDIDPAGVVFEEEVIEVATDDEAPAAKSPAKRTRKAAAPSPSPSTKAKSAAKK